MRDNESYTASHQSNGKYSAPFDKDFEKAAVADKGQEKRQVKKAGRVQPILHALPQRVRLELISACQSEIAAGQRMFVPRERSSTEAEPMASFCSAAATLPLPHSSTTTDAGPMPHPPQIPPHAIVESSPISSQKLTQTHEEKRGQTTEIRGSKKKRSAWRTANDTLRPLLPKVHTVGLVDSYVSEMQRQRKALEVPDLQDWNK